MELSKLILQEVLTERLRQNNKWGIQDHSLMIWLGILAEEFGEVAKEINEIHFRVGDIENTRKELIETAAVAVAMVECIDRHNMEVENGTI